MNELVPSNLQDFYYHHFTQIEFRRNKTLDQVISAVQKDPKTRGSQRLHYLREIYQAPNFIKKCGQKYREYKRLYDKPGDHKRDYQIYCLLQCNHTKMLSFDNSKYFTDVTKTLEDYDMEKIMHDKRMDKIGDDLAKSLDLNEVSQKKERCTRQVATKSISTNIRPADKNGHEIFESMIIPTPNILHAILKALESVVNTFLQIPEKIEHPENVVKICESLSVIILKIFGVRNLERFSSEDIRQIYKYFGTSRKIIKTSAPNMTQVINSCVNVLTSRLISPPTFPFLHKLNKLRNHDVVPKLEKMSQPSELESMYETEETTIYKNIPLTSGFHYNLKDLYFCYKDNQCDRKQFISIAKWILGYYCNSKIFDPRHKKGTSKYELKFRPENCTNRNKMHKLYLQVYRQDVPKRYPLHHRSSFGVLYFILSGKYQPFYFYKNREESQEILNLKKPEQDKIESVLDKNDRIFKNTKGAEGLNSLWCKDFEHLRQCLSKDLSKLTRTEKISLIQSCMKTVRQFHTQICKGNKIVKERNSWRFDGPSYKDCLELKLDLVFQFVEFMIVLGVSHKNAKYGEYKCKLFTKLATKILQVGYSCWLVLKRKYKVPFWNEIPKIKKNMVEAKFSELGIVVEKDEELDMKIERSKTVLSLSRGQSRASIN